MANELNTAIKNAATKVTKYIDDLSKMTVETRCVDLEHPSLTFDASKAVARTELSMDGDCTTILPTRTALSGGQEIDSEMFEAHLQVVATAIEFRARMMTSLMSMFGLQAPQIPAPPQITTLPKG